jgi:hypothetical protein
MEDSIRVVAFLLQGFDGLSGHDDDELVGSGRTHILFLQAHQPALGVSIAQDEDRAVKCIDYARVLWDQQDPWLKAAYPLSRPLDQRGSRQDPRVPSRNRDV